MRNKGWKGQWEHYCGLCIEGQTEEFVPEVLGMASALDFSTFTQSTYPSLGSLFFYLPGHPGPSSQ